MTDPSHPTTIDRASPAEMPDSLRRAGRALTDEPESIFRAIHNLPGVRSWKILNDIVFLLLSGVLGIMWFVVTIVGLTVGGALSIIGVGIPILAATIGALVWGAHLERSRIRVFLGIDIPSPYRDLPQDGGWIKRGWRMLRTTALWRDVAYLLLLFPIGLVELTVALVPLQFVISPVIAFFGGTSSVFWWEINSFPESILALAIGAILLVPLSILINLMAIAHGELAKRLLARSTEEILTERVEELTESRSAVMKAMHLERRRIERDLHDGAQQRLVSLAMDLGRARDRMESGDTSGAEQLLVQSHEESKIVLKELRDLVRGIHPAVLTDRGLDAAISAIAGRSPIPVDVDVELAQRLSDHVEGTAYFFVVEALTNIAKHSHASEATVNIRRNGRWLRIEVRDNGLGGANPTHGSGLAGLRDRIQALDGRMWVESPRGGGTRLIVEIPCES